LDSRKNSKVSSLSKDKIQTVTSRTRKLQKQSENDQYNEILYTSNESFKPINFSQRNGMHEEQLVDKYPTANQIRKLRKVETEIQSEERQEDQVNDTAPPYYGNVLASGNAVKPQIHRHSPSVLDIARVDNMKRKPSKDSIGEASQEDTMDKVMEKE